MQETAVTPPTPGAARVYDATWPALLTPAGGFNVAIGTPAFITRQGAGAPAAGNSSTSAGTVVWSGNVTPDGYRGRHGAIFRPGVGAPGTGALQTLDAMVMLPAVGTKNYVGDASDTDDWSCWRCFAMMAIEDQPSYAADSGILWASHNVGNYDITAGFASGFGFSQTASGQMSFIRRQGVGGPFTATVVRNAGDLGAWHSYEVRVIGAKPTTNALLKVFIDGLQVLSLDWVTDALPMPLASNGTWGYQTVLTAHGAGVGGGNAGFCVNRVRFMVGPTEQSLL